MFDHAVTADLSTFSVGASASIVTIGLTIPLLGCALIWLAARYGRDVRAVHQQMEKMWD